MEDFDILQALDPFCYDAPMPSSAPLAAAAAAAAASANREATPPPPEPAPLAVADPKGQGTVVEQASVVVELGRRVRQAANNQRQLPPAVAALLNETIDAVLLLTAANLQLAQDSTKRCHALVGAAVREHDRRDPPPATNGSAWLWANGATAAQAGAAVAPPSAHAGATGAASAQNLLVSEGMHDIAPPAKKKSSGAASSSSSAPGLGLGASRPKAKPKPRAKPKAKARPKAAAGATAKPRGKAAAATATPIKREADETPPPPLAEPSAAINNQIPNEPLAAPQVSACPQASEARREGIKRQKVVMDEDDE